MREKRESPTIDMCYFRGIKKSQPCTQTPQWRLKGDKHRFKVCDEHLAWGIRLSGFPALVEKYETDPHKRQEEDRIDATEEFKLGVKETVK